MKQIVRESNHKFQCDSLALVIILYVYFIETIYETN